MGQRGVLSFSFGLPSLLLEQGWEGREEGPRVLWGWGHAVWRRCRRRRRPSSSDLFPLHSVTLPVWRCHWPGCRQGWGSARHRQRPLLSETLPPVTWCLSPPMPAEPCPCTPALSSCPQTCCSGDERH